jgi:2-phospho-L-lactate guanylyltransferase
VIRSGETVAILPVKRFGDAKQRLVDGLQEGTRKALAEAMVTDVLIALRRATRVDAVLVVTGEPAAEALARGYDAEVVPDPDDAGHIEAARRGIVAAQVRDAGRILLVPGDCPALDPGEVDTLLDRGATGPSVVVVPDRHGTGTNALLITPPGAMDPAFGEGSRARHERLAAEAGARCEVIEVPTLGLDVDTTEDLAALRDALAGYTGGAAHTRGLLARVARL